MIPKTARNRPRRRRCRFAGVALACALLVAASATDVRAARWTASGSAVLDYKSILHAPESEQPLAKLGAVAEWSLKVNVDVSERVSASGRLCSACHGLTVNHAFAEVRFAPLANIDAGRIEVPFGDFYLRQDPASDVFLSKPLPYAMGHMLRYQSDRFNLGVVPMPYVDEGVVLFGDVWIRDVWQIWYGVWGANGFQSGTPRDFTFKDQLSDGGFSDNNDEPSWGGRLAFARGPVTAGASFLRGDYDPGGKYDYTVFGFDASAWIRGVQLRGEYVARENHVFVLASGDRAILRKKGFYVQAESPVVRRVQLVGRLDGLLRQGATLATENDASSAIVRWTTGINFVPSIDYALRFQLEHWRFTDFVDTNVLRFGVVTSY